MFALIHPLGASLLDFLMTLGISMLPVLELRAAIPYGMGMGLPWWQSFVLSVIGNLIPVPFIIIFIRRIFLWLKDRSKIAGWIYSLEKRALKKAETVYKYQLLGLCILVAIPLPGTGAWTGALVAALLDMRLKTAFPAIAIGVLIAGVIVSVVTYGGSAVFTSLAG